MVETEYYNWDEGAPPPTLDPHSLAKHEVLEQYLFNYVKILVGRPGIPRFSLNLIDGFSGGGIYTDRETGNITFGSPLIFLNSMRKAEKALNEYRTVPFSLDTKFYFVEKNRAFCNYLQRRIEEYGFRHLLENGRCACMNKSFAAAIDDILFDILNRRKGTRSIFLLDQYGYIDATLPFLRKIFSAIPTAEVILTFAADKLIDFYHKSEKYTNTLKTFGIDPESCDVSTQRGQFEWRYQMQSWIAKEILKKSGAKFFTRFFIVSRNSNRAYWLLHFSNHWRAHDEMVSIHWSIKNHFAHYGGPGLNAFPVLGFDPDRRGISELDFGADARKLSHDALMSDLPHFLGQYTDGISVGALRASTANGTPADMSLYRDVLGDLIDLRQHTIKTTKGGERREAGRIGMTDIVIPRRQLIFDLGPPQKPKPPRKTK